VDDFALTPAERALFAALRARGIKFMIIGLGAAVLEGAPVATQDIDLWFESLDTDQISLAAQDAGGFWISGFGMQPPAFGGDGLSRIDVVLTAHGLGTFTDEYPRPGHRQQTLDRAPERRGGPTRTGSHTACTGGTVARGRQVEPAVSLTAGPLLSIRSLHRRAGTLT
jgi:hypothetical protein